ncbi:MAG: heavy metal-binding domain-containing protein [Vicinamibacterales bacterium]
MTGRTLCMAAGLLLAVVLVQGQTRSGDIALRFHHLHYRVANPGAALGDAADAFQGTRTILQGLGVGVRIGREYVLFERQAADARERGRQSPADAYLEAARWLASQGIAISPVSLAATNVSRGWPDGDLDHVAFATIDLPSVVARISTRPFTVTEDHALFTLPSRHVVEVVRDRDLPDAWWCPMHPDIRSPGSGTCPVCSMALVPIPPPRVGEYKLDVALTPRAGGGASALTLAVSDPDTGTPVSRFIDIHERQLHLFVISKVLTLFEHIHPERRDDGTFAMEHSVPAGEYMLIADFLPAEGTSQVVQRAIVTPGYAGPIFVPAPTLAVSPVEQSTSGLRIRLEHEPLRPRRESMLRFVVTDADSGLPATDLEPYLGATGHLLIVSSDLSTAVHGHPEGVRTTGPAVTFGPVFPAPGVYKMWVQFQRRGQVITAPFIVRVSEPSV